MNPSRKQRRRLAKVADALLVKFRGPVDAGPLDLVYLSPEEPRGLTIAFERRAAFLAALGLEDVEQEIAAELRARSCPGGYVLPVLVVVDGWAQVAFQAAYPLTRGGAA